MHNWGEESVRHRRVRHAEDRIIPGVDSMHAPRLLCIASGLSCTKVGVIVHQSRGYRAPKSGLSCTKLFLPIQQPHFFQ
jgi:hypothetical protein